MADGKARRIDVSEEVLAVDTLGDPSYTRAFEIIAPLTDTRSAEDWLWGVVEDARDRCVVHRDWLDCPPATPARTATITRSRPRVEDPFSYADRDRHRCRGRGAVCPSSRESPRRQSRPRDHRSLRPAGGATRPARRRADPRPNDPRPDGARAVRPPSTFLVVLAAVRPLFGILWDP